MRWPVFAALCCYFAAGSLVAAADPQTWIREGQRLDEIVALYQQIHQEPELSLQEEKTSARLAEELRKLDIEVLTGIGGYGLAGILRNGEGPTILLRADMDALPVPEETGLEYASKVKRIDTRGNEVPAMHACGHDVHVANMVGVARYLVAQRAEWSGTIVFIGQPAEEIGAGALAMLDAGLFTKIPRPDFALALHVDAYLPAGQVGYRAGYALANTDSVDIVVRGRGGHGSMPQSTVDPIVQAAYLIVDLQSVVSREIAPLQPAVITVGAIHGGTKHNIIGDTCSLQLTVRSYSDEVRQHLLAAIERKAKAVAISFRAPEPLVKVAEGTPALFNTERLVDRLLPVFQKVVGEANVIESDQSMGGEDFGRFSQGGIPLFMYRLGSVDADRLARLKTAGTVPSLHSGKYYPDPRLTLETGISTMSAAVLELLKK